MYTKLFSHLIVHNTKHNSTQFVMANMYALRLHVDCMGENGLDILRELLIRNIDAYVMARENDASREHVQGWVCTDMRINTLRARIKRAFPGVVGNKGYSLSEVKDREAYRDYVLKGTPEEPADIVCSCSFDVCEGALRAAHRRYWSKHADRSKSKLGIVRETLEWAKSLCELPPRIEIARQVCGLIVGRNKPLMMHYVKGVVNAVSWSLDSREQEKMLEIINDFY